MKKNEPPLPSRSGDNSSSSGQFINKSAVSTNATAASTTTTTGSVTSRGNSSSTTTVITTNCASVTTTGDGQRVVYNQTISALIRGLHDTGIRDINTLHLPLVDEADEEVATAPTAVQPVAAQQQPLLTTKTLDHSRSTPNSVLSTPRAKSEIMPQASLPRLIINIDSADDGSVGGGIGAGAHGSYTARSLSPDDLELAKQNGTDLPLSPGGRRFSQFNFALRRFSHVHNPAVYNGRIPRK